jgi:uncharacterized protein involved in exopolysaccharide biosynthesis
VFLCVALPIILIGSRGLFQTTGSFTASCSVLLEFQGSEIPRWDTRGSHIDFDRELSTYRFMAMSVPVAQLATEHLADSLDALVVLDPSFDNLRKEESFVEYLLGGLDVSTMGESNMLEIRFTSIHPRMALAAVGACREAFMGFAVRASKNPQAITYYDEQIRSVTQEIDSLLVLRGAVLTAAGYASLEDDLSYDAGQLTRLEDEYYETMGVCSLLEGRINGVKDALVRDPHFAPLAHKDINSLSLTQAKAVVKDQQDKLNELQARHPENSVPVQRQREVLERALNYQKAEVDAYIHSLESELSAATEKARSQAALIATIKTSIAKAPEIYNQVTLLDAQIFALRSLLEDMQVKFGEVRMGVMADERISRMIRLTEPELITVFTTGRPILYFGIICILAITLGVVASFIADNQDHRIFNRKQAEQYLKVPVFASISQVK